MTCPYRGIASTSDNREQWYYCASPTRTEKQFEKLWKGRKYPEDMGRDCIDNETCPVAKRVEEKARKGEEAIARVAAKYKGDISDKDLWG